MTKRNLQPSPVSWLCYVFVATLAIGSSCQQSSAADSHSPKPSRPNFLVIVTDDQGWWDLAGHGNPVIKTPQMDKLRSEGVEFTRFYASPVCSLTRASIYTGRYPLRTGCYDTRFGHDTLGASEVTIGDILKSAGYKTAVFGKWHQGRYMASHPNNRGFDEFFGFWQYGHVERYFYPDRLWHNKERVDCRGHITDVLTDAAIDYVNAAEGPFCCFVTYNAPHYPFQALPDLTEGYLKQGIPLQDAQIYGLVEQCDSAVGRLLDCIEQRGLKDNTVVIFLSDNGGVSKFFKAGLRGGKGSVYEGGIRTPCFVRYSGHFPAATKTSAQCHVVDLLPTLVELAGAELPSDRTIDGVSLVPLLDGGEGKSLHPYLFHNWSRDTPRNDVKWAITSDKYKLVDGQLYDLEADPGESRNLAKSQPELAKQMREKYVAWFEDVCKGQKFGRVPIEVGREDENPVEIQMSWAALHGDKTSYTFDAYDWDIVDGWNHSGDAADWEVTVVRPGIYQVQIAYGCSQSDAGGSFTISAGDAHVSGKTEPTPTANTFITRTIGTIDLPAGPNQLRVTAESVPGKQLMALNRIWLKRLD